MKHDSPQQSDVRRLLARLSASNFFGTCFERKPIHLTAVSSAFYWTIPKIMSLIGLATRTRPLLLRAVLRGEVITPPRKLLQNELYEWALVQYQQNATLVLNRLEVLDPISEAYSLAFGRAMSAHF